MGGSGDWAACETWHELLDALCVEKGHLDNMALADQLCSATGNTTQAAFDTAVKNLRNWRQGAHIPRRRNFVLLTRILDVGQHPELLDRWNRLYVKAKSGVEDHENDASIEDAPDEAASSRRVLLIGMALAASAVVVLAAWWLWPYRSPAAAPDPAATFEGVQAEYVRNVSVKVGDAVIIHGARGNECGPAPSWESAKVLLPTLVTGTLTDGGVGTRLSRQCGGRVPARAILFTATEVGTELISLYGDDIHIRVEP